MLFIKNNQKGATMLETLGVLTIVSILSLSTIKLVGNIMAMFKQSLVVNEVRDIQQAISGRYSFEGNYSELFKDITSPDGSTEEDQIKIANFLCSEKMLPNQLCGGGMLHHRMGGDIWILKTDSSNKIYALQFGGLTDKACLNLAQINWHNKKKSNIYSISIIGDIEGTPGIKLKVVLPINKKDDTVKSFPILLEDIMVACKSNDNNVIQWEFY